MAELYGGVETGGTWCVCAVGSGPRQLVAREQFRTGQPQEALEQIEAFFESRAPVRALGVGAFGPIDPDEGSPTWGYVTSRAKPGWEHVSVGQRLRDRLGVPVAFDTDVNAAALGEYRWGAGQGLASLCYLTVGTGIGAGFVTRGSTWRGLIHPEVGHLRIPHDRTRDDFAGSCRIHGDCWEGLASGEAIAKRCGCAPATLLDEDPVWELEAEYLALGLLAIVCVASPHRIVAGGGVLERAGLLERVGHRLTELLGGYLSSPLLNERIGEYLVAPRLGDDAGVLGAIALAQDLVKPG